MNKIHLTVYASLIIFFACNSNSPTAPPLDAQPIELVNAFPNLNFSSPVFLTSSKDGTNRIFVVERPGVIQTFANDSAATGTETFLDIRGRVTSGSEMGLLGLAFHPDFENNGRFYVNYTTTQNGPGRTVIAEFTTTGNLANPNSERIVLEINQFADNHNGGMIEFGPDGYLYIGLGDGGGGSDPRNNGQDKTTLLATILRIDVNNRGQGLEYAIPADNPFVGDGGGVREEIFAYGLRNPWRFSLDEKTGQLWVGDVGQNRREEIDIVASGANLGWPRMEGFDCFDQNQPNNPPANCDKTGLVLPVKDYAHGLGCAVTGGYVYRGARRPGLVGAYVYGDFCTGSIWMLRYENGSIVPGSDSLLIHTTLSISSFGVDEKNELYIINLNGQIYRFKGSNPTLVAEHATAPTSFDLTQNYPRPLQPGNKNLLHNKNSRHS